MAANSRARASTIAGVTVPMPAAFAITIPLFSGFFLMRYQVSIRIYLELRDEHSGELRCEDRSRFDQEVGVEFLTQRQTAFRHHAICRRVLNSGCLLCA